MFNWKFISLRAARRYVRRYGGGLSHRDVNGYRMLLDRYKQPKCFISVAD